MIKVYWLDDLTLAYILDHAVCCASATSSGRSLHLIISQLRTKYSSSNCSNNVRRTKCSVKKRIIVRRTVRSKCGEQTVRPLKDGPKASVGLPWKHSSGAVWESRWPSWAVRPNEPSGFRGRKAILKTMLRHWSQLVPNMSAGRTVCSPNILRTVRRTIIRFLIELLVRRTWFGQFDEL